MIFSVHYAENVNWSTVFGRKNHVHSYLRVEAFDLPSTTYFWDDINDILRALEDQEIRLDVLLVGFPKNTGMYTANGSYNHNNKPVIGILRGSNILGFDYSDYKWIALSPMDTGDATGLFESVIIPAEWQVILDKYNTAGHRCNLYWEDVEASLTD